MPLKIKGTGLPDGSENTLVKKILFYDPYQKISADLRRLKYGSDAAWARAYSVSLFGGDTTGLDPDSISLQVSSTDTVTGTSTRYIVEQNAINSGLSEAEKLVYDGDVLSISASAAKGYTAPTVTSSVTVSADIDLDDYISTGRTMGIESPSVTNNPTYDVYFTGYPVSVTVFNSNAFTVSLCYYTSSSSTDSGTYETVGDIGANSQTTFEIPAASIDAGSPWPKKYVHLKFVYGAAASSFVYELGRVDSTPTNSFSPSSVSVQEGDTVSVTCYLAWGDTETVYLSAYPGGIISFPQNVSGEQFTLNITGVSAGTTTLTASCYVGNGSDVSLASSASCTVTVTAKPVQQPTDYIALEQSSLFLYGTSDVGTINASASGAVSWTSSKPSVAKAIAIGSYKCSVMPESNGSTVITGTCGSASATCTVTVSGISSSSPGSSTGSCLAADTPILIDYNKYEIIENLRVGDFIMGYDMSHNLIKTKIINKYRAVTTTIYKLVLSDLTELFITGNHPVMRLNDYANIEGIFGYEKLNIGDMVLSTNGYVSVIAIQKIKKKSLVYNIYTELDNFIAKNIVVACENPDTLIIGENCFEVCEGWSGSTVSKSNDTHGSACVSPDTHVATPNNTYRLAKDLRKGDVILCYDNNMNLVETPILNTYYAKDFDLYRITFEDGTYLDVTYNHPILCETEYCNVAGVLGYTKLQVGQRAVSTHGKLKIVDISKINTAEKVYNIYTELDNFIANDIVVACENPDTLIVGVNCFETPEGMAKFHTP